VAASGARAQQPGKIYRVGRSPTAPDRRDRRASQTLLSVLAARGFVEGRNLVFVQRSADAQPSDSTVSRRAQDRHVEVIVTFGYPAALAAKMSAQGVPIVVTGAGDPVATGLVDGVARPGGNITGVTELSTELSAKAPRNPEGYAAGPLARGNAVERGPIWA